MGYVMGRDGNGYGNCGYGGLGGFGGDWLALLIIFALFGNNGWGFGENGGNGMMNYEIGRLATTNDVASGFSTSEIMSDLNDILLGQSQGFAAVQQTLCQGFNGIERSIADTNSNLANSICTLGYQNQAGFNALSTQLAQCCCDTRSAIADVKYSNERNTCDIIRAGQDNTRAILDFLTTEKISALQAENSGLKAQISNDRQSAFIIDALAPKCPVSAYVVQPPQQVTFPTNCCGNVAYANGGCGCGC
jgi:hypothetical protein